MSEKTEQPTPKRLREAREKGDVCKSQDIAPALTVLAVGLYFTANAENVFDALRSMVTLPMEVFHLPYEQALALAVPTVLRCAFLVVLPVVALVMTTALVALLAQTGVLFAFKAAVPKLENLSPKKWFQKVFSIKNLFEFVKNVVKVCVLAAVVRAVLEKHLPLLFRMADAGIGPMWEVLARAIGDLVLYASGAFCVIAALDYLYQKYKYNQNHMMSKDEVKREYKESEGDPHIKSKRKQLHKEMIAQNALDGVRKAKVLVTNPTHYAVALDYDKEKTPLPLILAKGEGMLAQRMMEVARQEGIPIMRNVPLARALYSEGTENAYIPKELIAPVAEVLRWVQSLEK